MAEALTPAPATSAAVAAGLFAGHGEETTVLGGDADSLTRVADGPPLPLEPTRRRRVPLVVPLGAAAALLLVLILFLAASSGSDPRPAITTVPATASTTTPPPSTTLTTPSPTAPGDTRLGARFKKGRRGTSGGNGAGGD
jgi:hypothetical protein